MGKVKIYWIKKFVFKCDLPCALSLWNSKENLLCVLTLCFLWMKRVICLSHNKHRKEIKQLQKGEILSNQLYFGIKKKNNFSIYTSTDRDNCTTSVYFCFEYTENLNSIKANVICTMSWINSEVQYVYSPYFGKFFQIFRVVLLQVN